MLTFFAITHKSTEKTSLSYFVWSVNVIVMLPSVNALDHSPFLYQWLIKKRIIRKYTYVMAIFHFFSFPLNKHLIYS